MIILKDTFNNRTISQHRSIGAAVASQRRHLARVQARNGRNSYLTYVFIDSTTGEPVDQDVVMAARHQADMARG